jgi:hypothetical protein
MPDAHGGPAPIIHHCGIKGISRRYAIQTNHGNSGVCPARQMTDIARRVGSHHGKNAIHPPGLQQGAHLLFAVELVVRVGNIQFVAGLCAANSAPRTTSGKNGFVMSAIIIPIVLDRRNIFRHSSNFADCPRRPALKPMERAWPPCWRATPNPWGALWWFSSAV